MKKIISIICAAATIAIAASSCDKKTEQYSPEEYTGELTDGGENDVVNLGLSTWWCTANVLADSPEKTGGLFKWGSLIDARTKANPTMAEDPATHYLGANYRTPTKNELNELCTSCTWKYVKYKGHLGYIISGENGNCIFLPFTNGSMESKDYCGKYWSKESSSEYSVMTMFFDHEGHYVMPSAFGDNIYMAIRGVYGGEQ